MHYDINTNYGPVVDNLTVSARWLPENSWRLVTHLVVPHPLIARRAWTLHTSLMCKSNIHTILSIALCTLTPFLPPPHRAVRLDNRQASVV